MRNLFTAALLVAVLAVTLSVSHERLALASDTQNIQEAAAADDTEAADDDDPYSFRGDPYRSAPAYVRPLSANAKITPLITTGQLIRLTGGFFDDAFRFVGIPDGMGLYRRNQRLVLLTNHEFNANEGGAAGPLASGARISELRLTYNEDEATPLRIRTGKYAIQQLFESLDGSSYVPVEPGTKSIARLCSAFLATDKVGFDRPIFLAGEETSTDVGTFDGRGGLAFATFEGKSYTLPRLGRFAWENSVVVPFSNEKTVIFGLEDGPSTGTGLASELYMYVGDKNAVAIDPLEKNGLNNGRLYVLVGDDSGRNSEASFNQKNTSVTGHWEEVDWRLNGEALATAAQTIGAFGFIRIEDGAADPVQPGTLYFDTTGAPASANPFGRLYRLNFNPVNPTGPVTLTILLDGTEGVISPDNLDINKHGEIAINEDPNYNLANLGLTRDSSIWIYNTNTLALERIAEIDRNAARAHAIAANAGNSSVAASDIPGGWETSGIIDAEEFLGRGSWLFNVQAHSLRIVPIAETVQGGQILHLNWKP